MNVLRITREDGRLVTLSNLIQMYKDGQLQKTNKPYQHRDTEEQEDDNPVRWSYYDHIGDLINAAQAFKEIEDKLMWGKVIK